MARKGITSVDVVQAYVALLKQGRKPGPTNLRLELGRGSYTTIAQHLRQLALHQATSPTPGTSIRGQRRFKGGTGPARGRVPVHPRR